MNPKLFRTSLMSFLVLSGLASQDLSTTDHGLNLTVVGVRRDASISIKVNLRNSNESRVFVPTCGELRGDNYLCDLAVHVEAETPQGWQPAKLKFDSAVLGGIPPEKGVVIEPGRAATFVCEFNADLFKLSKGQRLRLIVDTWSDEPSMKARKTPLRLVSPVFKKP